MKTMSIVKSEYAVVVSICWLIDSLLGQSPIPRAVGKAPNQSKPINLLGKSVPFQLRPPLQLFKPITNSIVAQFTTAHAATMGLIDLLSDLYASISFTEVHADAPASEEKEDERQAEGGEEKGDEGGDEKEEEEGEEEGGEQGGEEESGDEREEEKEEEEEEEQEPEDPKPKLEEGMCFNCLRPGDLVLRRDTLLHLTGP